MSEGATVAAAGLDAAAPNPNDSPVDGAAAAGAAVG